MKTKTINITTLQAFAKTGPLNLRAKGECMSDTFPDGALLTVKHRRLYLPGDIVVYARADGELVSHRLLGYGPWKGAWRILTKGDHYDKTDPPGNLKNVLGRVEGVDGQISRCGFLQRLKSSVHFAATALTAIISSSKKPPLY